MDMTTALEWAGERSNAVLITLRSDGRAQSSDITYTVQQGRFVISITTDRAKTNNMRRDPRVVLHITDPAAWSYASFDGVVELSEPAGRPDDETADRLVDYYRAVTSGEHPNWDEYRDAMVAEGRLIALVDPQAAVGQIR